MDKIFNQIKELIDSLSLVRKISMLLVLGLSISAILYLVHVTNKTSMEPLFTNLNAEDMGSILTQLDKQNTKYEIDQAHRSVMVPATDVLDIRMKLAESGLPRHGGIGFEIFDKTNFGLSDFEQRVIFQRALEGELSRTIGGLEEVENARIHLVLPEKSLFADTAQEASASVVLKLKSKVALSRDRVNAITHLVASAVDNLDSQSVTVVDNEGHLLSAGNDGDDSIAGDGQVFEQKVQIERSFEKRIVDLLSPVVGLGKVVARVTANIDFTSVESTDEIVDPSKSAVLSESRTAGKKSESSSSTGGAAGATANLPGASGGGASGGNGTSDDSSEQINYQVSRTVRKQVTPRGSVKNLSVAILVDGTYTEKDGKQEFAARAPEELQKIEELVKKAIGFAADRGDQIKVENMKFQPVDLSMPNVGDSFLKDKTTYGFILNIAGNALVVLIMAFVFFFVVRPLIKNWGGGGVGQQLTAPGALETEIRANMAQLIRQDPMAAANAIRQWLK